MNKVILVGRLCSDPELKYVGENNVALTNFTLAVNRNYKNTAGEYDADFISCELWDKQAENFCKYTYKGKLISVDGKLKVDNYTNHENENRYRFTVRVTSFNFISNNIKKESSSSNFNSNEVFSDEVFDSEISEDEVPF